MSLGRLPESCRDVGDRLQKTLMSWRKGIDPKGHSILTVLKTSLGRDGEELLESPYSPLASLECLRTREQWGGMSTYF